MGALIRAHVWAASPLGALDDWPQSLKTAVGIMLATRHPVILYWGPQHICLYNDAVAASLGPEKHPSILGRPAKEAWPEVSVLEAELKQVMAGGEPTWHENRLAPIYRHGRLDEVYWTYSYAPVQDADAPNGVGGVLVLITETTEAVVSRRQSEERYRTLFGSIDEGFCIVELMFNDAGEAVDYVFVEINPAFEAQTGLTGAVGKSMRTLRPEHESHWFEAYGRVALTGQAERFEREAGALGRWYNVFAFRVGDPDQRRVAVLFYDITERKRDQEHAQLLMAEIDHRARNLLAVVQAVVHRTQAPTAEAFAAAVQGRIQALARAHALLASNRWQGAELTRLVREELAPFGPIGERTIISGPIVALKSAAAQSIALALHELAGNAAKHGALSLPQGRVTVRWAVDAASGQLSARWDERGGPPVVRPCHVGFGMAVIKAGIEHQLGGTVRTDWQPEGLVCELTLPAKQIDNSPLWL